MVRDAGIGFVFGGLVATEASLVIAFELRRSAGVTSKTIGFGVGAVEGPRMLQPVGVPRVGRMTDAASGRAHASMWGVGRGLEFGQMAADAEAGRWRIARR